MSDLLYKRASDSTIGNIFGNQNDSILSFAGKSNLAVNKKTSACMSDRLVFRIARDLCPNYAPNKTESGCCELNKSAEFNDNLYVIAIQSTSKGKLDGVFEWAKKNIYGDIESNEITLTDLTNEDDELYSELINAAELESVKINYTLPPGSSVRSQPIIRHPKWSNTIIDAKSVPINVENVVNLWDAWWPVKNDRILRNVLRSFSIAGNEVFVDKDTISFITNIISSIKTYKKRFNDPSCELKIQFESGSLTFIEEKDLEKVATKSGLTLRSDSRDLLMNEGGRFITESFTFKLDEIEFVKITQVRKVGSTTLIKIEDLYFVPRYGKSSPEYVPDSPEYSPDSPEYAPTKRRIEEDTERPFKVHRLI